MRRVKSKIVTWDENGNFDANVRRFVNRNKKVMGMGKLKDIKDMPDFNSEVKNGTDSVSTGKVYLNKRGHVYCKEHGAMNRVTKEGIYRCISAVTMAKNDAVVNLCNEGAWYPKENKKEALPEGRSPSTSARELSAVQVLADLREEIDVLHKKAEKDEKAGISIFNDRYLARKRVLLDLAKKWGMEL